MKLTNRPMKQSIRVGGESMDFKALSKIGNEFLLEIEESTASDSGLCGRLYRQDGQIKTYVGTIYEYKQ